MGCGRWGQDYYPTLAGRLCRSCARKAGDLRSVVDIDAERLARGYPAGSYCKLDTSHYPKPTRSAFIPGHGRVEFEVVWNGT
jgi:hypothetical protein